MGQLDELLKKYKSTVMPGSVERPRTWISQGPLSLNLAIGDPRGVKTGRIIQIVGKYSSGKSTLALDIVAQHQKATGNPVVYADFERSFDKEYAEAVGVNTNALYIVRGDSTEDGFSFVEKAVKSGDIRLVIIDSVAAAKPSNEDEKDYGENAKMAGNSGIITRFVNRIVPLIDNHDVLLICLNQLRANFNTMSPEREIPYGAKSLHYATSVMIQLTNIKNTEEETEIQAVIKKNKVGAPRHVTRFMINYGKGIDHAQDIIQLALEKDIVVKSGSWFSYNGIKAQGMERAIAEFPVGEIQELVLSAYE